MTHTAYDVPNRTRLVNGHLVDFHPQATVETAEEVCRSIVTEGEEWFKRMAKQLGAR